MSLSGKSAVVTGAGMGIGKAMAEILLLNGAKVAILDVNKAALQSFKESLNKQFGAEKSLTLECDVQSEQQFKAAFQKAVDAFGGVDIFVNNAGILDEAAWEKCVNINYVSVIRGSYLALDHMNKLSGGRGGVVVNTASLAGLGPFLCCPVYSGTKHAVIGFTRSMASASEASGYGIRFNAICPSFVQTDLFTNIPVKLGRFDHLKEKNDELVQLFGVLDTSKVAEGLLQLVTDETKNGQALVVKSDVKDYVTFPDFQL
ncbi:unnamed protein product [Ophioblennius macclurei]